MSRHDERRLERDARHAEHDTFQPMEQAEDTRITSDMSPSEIELRVRRRIENRRKQIAGFMGNLISYLAVNAALWIVFGFTARDVHGFPWPLFVTLGWGIGLIAHGYQLYQNLPGVVARREQSLQREVARVKAQMGLSDSYGSYVSSDYGEKPKNTEKQKNNQPVRLTADGELIPSETDSAELDSDEAVDKTHWHNQLTDRRY